MQMPAGQLRVRHARQGRGDREDWNRTLRPFHGLELRDVMMPCQHQFRAMGLQDFAKSVPVAQGFSRPPMAHEGGVMDQHHAKQSLGPRLVEQGGETVSLALPELSRCAKDGRRERGGKTDDRQRAAPPKEREGVLGSSLRAHISGQPGLPLAEARLPWLSRCEVMIAGYDGKTIGWPQPIEIVAYRGEFGRVAEIGEITGEGDMVRGMRCEIGLERRSGAQRVDMVPLVTPGEHGQGPLSAELSQ